jgi:hypothetical protein
LLEALKILNVADTKNDPLKLCVLLLLASIYQDTDFGLAEKMATAAYEYAKRLGNDTLAWKAGTILVKILTLKGDREKADKQTILNEAHKIEDVNNENVDIMND